MSIEALENIVVRAQGKVICDGTVALGNVIGAGTDGVVFRGSDIRADPTTPLDYAVKVTPRDAVRQEELDCYRSVAHLPGIVSLVRIDGDEEFIYVVMAHWDHTLQDAMVDYKCFMGKREDLIKSVFAKIIDAVSDCHSRGVFHRDLKPENILISCDLQKVCLTDFSIATRDVVSDQFGLGTEYFRSPECCDTHPDRVPYSTRRNDIWALGVILLILAVDTPPWQAPTGDCMAFTRYFYDADYLRERVPISLELQKLLKRVWTPRQEHCMSLAALKKAVLEMPSLYMNRKELRWVNSMVLRRADYFLESTELQLPLPSRRVIETRTEAYKGAMAFIKKGLARIPKHEEIVNGQRMMVYGAAAPSASSSDGSSGANTEASVSASTPPVVVRPLIADSAAPRSAQTVSEEEDYREAIIRDLAAGIRAQGMAQVRRTVAQLMVQLGPLVGEAPQ